MATIVKSIDVCLDFLNQQDVIDNDPNTSNTNSVDDFKKAVSTDLLSLGIHSTADDRLKVSVIPPSFDNDNECKRSKPVIICCVVDTSGSMSTDAIIKDTNGKTESHGLSILDLVKHSIKTIIECLNDNDYLSIISYSNNAKIVTNLIKMNVNNKKKTLNELEKLGASGQTNLWDGLLNGLEQLRKCKNINCSLNNSAIMLFTDGLPNIIPPNGHIAMIDKYIKEYKQLNGIINTYGFGYSLDTKLLNDIALKGNGNYSFIPDSSMVGTIFVNSISNFCCNVAKDIRLNIDINKKYDATIIGGYDYIKTDNPDGININLGSIMYGQNKDIIIKFELIDNNEFEGNEGSQGTDNKNDIDIDDKPYKILSLNYISLITNKYISIKDNIKIFDDDIKPKNKLTEIHYYRLLSCDILRECMESMKINDMNDAQNKLRNLIKTIKGNKLINKNKYIIDLLTDLSGQAFEAISRKDYYDKWGKHYLPSLVFAHLHEYNNNFKDPGVQHYGGKLFNKLRDKANDIFIKMPAPKPSKPSKPIYKTAAAAHTTVSPSMSTYMNASGGCFDGNCTVKMYDNSLKFIKNLNVNDRVKNGAYIKCIIKYKCKNGKNILSTLYNYNSLKITPYHPILINNKWIFPIDIDNGNHKEEICEYVYNFILSSNHILIVNNIKCCTLAHNFNHNNVIKHEYFGTNKIINDLKKFNYNGWKNGKIIINHDSFRRDPNTNLIYKLIQ